MTCRAIRHDTGRESIPLLLVRRGELTPRQCDHEFRGVTGDCPTCQLMIDSADLGDGSAYAAAMARLKAHGVGVAYRRFGYGSDGGVEPWRVCHWGHPRGYWEGVPFRECQNRDTESHRINLEVIRGYYERSFKPEDGYVIKVEPTLRRPGDPPRPYSPDLAVYGPKGERLVAVEYQRSYESFEKFRDRDLMRRAAPESWTAVDWWFDDTMHHPNSTAQTVYGRSHEHRTYLSHLPVRHYRCWVDPDTLVLQGDHGRCGDLPQSRRTREKRHIEKTELQECSTARIMQQIESGPEREIVKDYREPLRPITGSDLNFLADLTYSLEREKRLAEAVIARSHRLEEQDRRHREYGVKCQLVEQIQALLAAMQGLIEAESSACIDWTVERLEEELERISGLWPAARREKARRERLAAVEAEAARREEAERQRQAEEAERVAAAVAVAEAHRLEAGRRQQWEIQEAERRRHREAEEAERAEMQRQALEAELHWHPIEFFPLTRDQQRRPRLKTMLMPGDRVREQRGRQEEVYQCQTGAGYSTDRATYTSLNGWQVWRKQRREP